jgi:hypothetical protein
LKIRGASPSNALRAEDVSRSVSAIVMSDSRWRSAESCGNYFGNH